ncbi:MAG: RecX family transcriptional regulator [Rhodospirillales bacterium]|nr:MAG: RecX family transcriptional regulator [Rhodospirillales bacterium]
MVDRPEPVRGEPRRPFAKPITVRRLENVAAAYVDRYASTSARLRDVLTRRVRNARRLEAPVVEGVEDVIEAIVAKYVAAGILDDARFARQKAASLRRRGTSTRRVREKLAHAGVPRDDIDGAMAAVREEAGDADGAGELTAAIELARRRRLGPFSDPATRAERRDKHLAAMGRAGFPLAIARRVVDATDIDALRDE